MPYPKGVDLQVGLVEPTTGAPLLATAAALGDSVTNPTTTGVAAYTYYWDGATWQRPIGHNGGSDARDNTFRGVLVQSNKYVFNGTTWDRVRSANQAAGTTGIGVPAAGSLVFDATNWQKLKGNTDGSLPVGGFTPAAPTCTFTRAANTTAYTIGDEVGTAGTAPTTIPVGRVNGGSGILQGANLFYSGYPATVPQLVVLVFTATVTLAGDNAQLNLSDAHAANLIATIPLTASQSTQYSAGAAVAAGGVWLSGVPSRPAPHFVLGASEQTLYVCLITLNAFTPIANSETLQLWLDVELN